jgi:hypothetical protein
MKGSNNEGKEAEFREMGENFKIIIGRVLLSEVGYEKR